MLIWAHFINITCGLMPVYLNMALEHSKRACMIFHASLLMFHPAAHQFLQAAMENSPSLGINEAISSLADFENIPNHVAEKVREIDTLFIDFNKSQNFKEATVKSIFANFGKITTKLVLLGSPEPLDEQIRKIMECVPIINWFTSVMAAEIEKGVALGRTGINQAGGGITSINDLMQHVQMHKQRELELAQLRSRNQTNQVQALALQNMADMAGVTVHELRNMNLVEASRLFLLLLFLLLLFFHLPL